MTGTGINRGSMGAESSDFLSGVRVIEWGGQLVEYAGRVLADLGADVIKLEPRQGEYTRRFGPFAGDIVDTENSLHFWNYNLDKRSYRLAADDPAKDATARALIDSADIVLDGRKVALPGTIITDWLIHVRVTPFGETGPWSDFVADDLIHLALGGMMMNCGYSPEDDGNYTTPPIAPQVEQAFHIAGESAVIGALTALNQRSASSRGQRVSVSVHDAVSKNTEQDVPNWLHLRQKHLRQTGRHSSPTITPDVLSPTADGRYLMPYQTYLKDNGGTYTNTVQMLADHGIVNAEELQGELAVHGTVTQEQTQKVKSLVDQLIQQQPFSADLWLDAQQRGLPWAPVRQPGDNLTDEHWLSRDTFAAVEHPERRRPILYATGRWVDSSGDRAKPTRAPRLGEHNAECQALVAGSPRRPTKRHPANGIAAGSDPNLYPHAGLKVLDLSWLLASGGAGRFFSGLGAHVVKVEHRTRWDRYRWGVGRVVDDAAGQTEDPNRSGSFMDINSGKQSLGLNLKSSEGVALLRELIAWCDVLLEGFSPGTMDRMGLGYETMAAINPQLIYVQQSGLGQHGVYGRLRSYGPTAQAISGLTEMSGLPHPNPPAGIGYSYLDWFGAYNMATAVNAALYRRSRKGIGCHIDASQVEAGIYLTGTALLDAQVNDRPWRRTGNSPITGQSHPSGAFPVKGRDRWLAISCRSNEEWEQLRAVLGDPTELAEQKFATPAGRHRNGVELSQLIAAETSTRNGPELMLTLQCAGVPSGMCQTAQDRVEKDPQLRHLGWLEELPQSSMGTVAVKTLPFRLNGASADIGGLLHRAGPSYGEDTRRVSKQILNSTDEMVDALLEAGTIDDGRQWRGQSTS